MLHCLGNKDKEKKSCTCSIDSMFKSIFSTRLVESLDMESADTGTDDCIYTHNVWIYLLRQIYILTIYTIYTYIINNTYIFSIYYVCICIYIMHV